MKALVAIVLALSAASAAGAQAQEGALTDAKFYRIHLRNGNFIDGDIVRQSPKEIVLRMKFGEMNIRQDLIERIEFVKMKGVTDKTIELETQKPPPPAGDVRRELKSPTPKRSLAAELYKPSEEIRKKVDPLLRRLAEASAEEKPAVIDELQAVDAEGGPYLASLLGQLDRSDVPAVLAAIVKIKNAEAGPILARYTTDPSPAIRAAAASGIGGLGDEKSGGSVLPLLSDKDATVRAEAASSLTLLGLRDAFEPLMKLGADPDREVRSRALNGLVELSDKHGLTQDLITGLGHLLETAKGPAKVDLLAAIGKTQKKDIWPSVTPCLRDDQPEVRAMAATALNLMGAGEAGDALLVQAGAEHDAKARVQIAAALARLSVKKGVEPLIPWLRDEHEDVRIATAHALDQLTGLQLGQDAEKWETWWAQNKEKQP